MKGKICNAVAEKLNGVEKKEILEMMTVPPDESMGDFALPCFSFAKAMRKNPVMIAEELKIALEMQKDKLGIEKVEVVNGYLNIFMNREKYVTFWMKKLNSENYGIEKTGESKTVCMDYSSPNIAKNFHVGHLRTTVIGNSIYKLHEKLGYHVVRINHLGDWGTQFGKLIVAYLKWSSKEAVEKEGIEELLRIYVKFNQEAETNPSLIEEARVWFVKMEQNDEQALEIWEWFKEISLIEFERVYDMLGISFDSYTGESFYRNMVPALVEELEHKHLLQESQGAKVIDLSEYDMPPCLIVKSDGGSIYHSRDIAAILYRKNTYGFEKCLYVTGLEQTLHFKQVFKAIEVMGYPWYDGLVHIPYGLVSLSGQKLSSRSGNIIYAEDILKEAVSRALHAIEEKNPELADKEDVAKKVGVGAVIFHDLWNQRIKNIEFSWDEVLSFEGTTGPYVQYTFARAKSILRKCNDMACDKKVDANLISDAASYALIKALAGYSAAVNKAVERYEPSVVARYIIDVAVAFNKFYHDCPILHAAEEEKAARLQVVNLTQKIILDACGLLGMDCPEEM